MRAVKVVLVLLLAGSSNCARILVLTLYPARSHWIVLEPLLLALASNGHNLTVFSSFPQQRPAPNYTDVDLSSKLPPASSNFETIRDYYRRTFATPYDINYLHSRACKALEKQELQNLMRCKGQYDLLITQTFGDECFSYFAHKLDVPMVSVITSVPLPWTAEKVGLPDNPAYISSYAAGYGSHMTLWQRMSNTIILLHSKLLHYCLFDARTHREAEKSFGEPLPPVAEVVANTSLLLVNSHFTLSGSRPLPPNVVEVGGIHIRQEQQPLPEDLQNILDASDDGVVLMSFGSVVNASSIPKSTIMMFMNVFAKLPQTVIFKYEDDLPEAPPNVVIRKWLPQRDLIAHERVLALINHGGLGSTMEAVNFATPIIGIPLFGDQHGNVQNVVSRGAGVHLDLFQISEEQISAALSEILRNKTYAENMKKLSQQFRDRPMTALQAAVYWTEYVLRHQGAPQLRPASVNLPFYQYLLLDVAATLAALLCALYLTAKWTTVRLARALVARSKKKTN